MERSSTSMEHRSTARAVRGQDHEPNRFRLLERIGARSTLRMRAVEAILIGAVVCGASCSVPVEQVAASEVIAVPGSPRAPCIRSSVPCVDMYVSAHEDDDLLFMNPEIERSIQRGNRVITVFVTAGN